jgi:hypothetical protein
MILNRQMTDIGCKFKEGAYNIENIKCQMSIAKNEISNIKNSYQLGLVKY